MSVKWRFFNNYLALCLPNFGVIGAGVIVLELRPI
jgi:hypothetical protein